MSPEARRGFEDDDENIERNTDEKDAIEIGHSVMVTMMARSTMIVMIVSTAVMAVIVDVILAVVLGL